MEGTKVVCVWKFVDAPGWETFDYWQTRCGKEFYLSEGTPSKHGMIYCPFCACLIREEEDGSEAEITEESED